MKASLGRTLTHSRGQDETKLDMEEKKPGERGIKTGQDTNKKIEKKRVRCTHSLEWDHPGHEKKGASEGGGKSEPVWVEMPWVAWHWKQRGDGS